MLITDQDKVGLEPHYPTRLGGWSEGVSNGHSPLHQLSPYIGKMKPSMARELISTFTKPGDTIYDPFCGSGTIALESWITGRNAISCDLNPYALCLTRGKLTPYDSHDAALDAINEMDAAATRVRRPDRALQAPDWVRAFFHPETLADVLSWVAVLRRRHDDFLLSCLLGILHHQRPGFLSYPSSHTVPYLRERLFPRLEYPELYEYRAVKERLERKARRALARLPDLDRDVGRSCVHANSACYKPECKVDAIITSPPYMGQLDYGRDNRLRLWFLGVADWRRIDSSVSPTQSEFLALIERCLRLWRKVLRDGGICALVVGDASVRSYSLTLPNVITRIATQEVGGFDLVTTHTEPIPAKRRVRRGYSGSLSETVVVFSKQSGA